ncbi:MAG: MotA/TolQ/ExbB proton channel family protein [Gammaproteobacteria bacterium]|nr:MotA/TolQ/ExbB proton channel family protein [Gammaproteobacteria bacterium]
MSGTRWLRRAHQDPDVHAVFLRWLVAVTAMAGVLFVLWEQGLLAALYVADRSHLSVLISAAFLVMTGYCGVQAFRVSQGLNALMQPDAEGGDHLPTRWAGVWERAGMDGLRAELDGPVEAGWFAADLLIKLGLLGTVVGFILMLASVGDIRGEGVEELRAVLTRMSAGMRVALYTTLTGLVTAMLLGLQVHLLERGVVRLLARLGPRPSGPGREAAEER